MPSPPPRLDLPPDVRRTFRFHATYAVLDGICGGILLNAPFMALNELGAQNWQLPLRDVCTGVGMLASLYLGSWMAPRRKMPFVFLPGIMAGLCSLAMVAALAAGSPFWFLLAFGVGGAFEVVTRPAIAAILRENYPVAGRAQLTAAVRQRSSLAFASTLMLSAWILSSSGSRVTSVAGVEILCAAVIGLTAFLCFRRIPTRDVCAIRTDFRIEFLKNMHDAVDVVTRDARFRRLLFGCLMEGFFSGLALSLVAALLKTLGFGYVGCAALKDGIPTFVAFATTGVLGRYFDRSNPWVSWAWVRFAFGGDLLLLAAAPLAAQFLPPAVIGLVLLGRVLRGSTQGGWWILWWQIGITHFAPPGQDTSRYAAIMVFLPAVVRIAAALAGIGLAYWGVRPETLLWVGGAGVILSGLYSLWQASRDRKEHRPATFTEFEAQFNDP